jgi:hypothetical protein
MDQASSIGSSIQVSHLRPSGIADYDEFLSQIAARSSDTSVSCLLLDNPCWKEWEVLAELLPSWSSLKELYFETIHDHFYPNQIVGVLRECWNLHRVSMTKLNM